MTKYVCDLNWRMSLCNAVLIALFIDRYCMVRSVLHLKCVESIWFSRCDQSILYNLGNSTNPSRLKKLGFLTKYVLYINMLLKCKQLEQMTRGHTVICSDFKYSLIQDFIVPYMIMFLTYQPFYFFSVDDEFLQ